MAQKPWKSATASPEELRVLGQSLLPDDKVILESTGNALEIARVLEPFVSEVVIANPMHVRAISHAKVKNDQFGRAHARRTARR